MSLILNKILPFVLLINFVLFGAEKFDYGRFDLLLKKYVNGDKVDYKGMMTEKETLFLFTSKLAKISPDSHPKLFPTKNEKLAYWINAYNACILETILKNYPVESIKDINLIGFTIWLNTNKLGGEDISFKSLEDDIIRDRFKDPRIHFAINCASASCPPLINEAYVSEKIDEQMDKSTSDFINNEQNFRIVEGEKEIYISAIFDWYEDDFIDWLTEKYPNKENPVILDYIKLYYKGSFKSEWYDFDIEVNDYDWSLNE